MTVALDSNMVYLQTRLNINTGRMSNYADKSLDEIIAQEAKEGNTVAKEFKRELFGDTDELIESFSLGNVDNKFNVIKSLNEEQLEKILPMLSPEDLVFGLNFFTQDKLLKMFQDVPSAEAVNVALEAFPMEQVIQMMPEEHLEKFFFSDDVEKKQVIKQLKNMPHEILTQMVEGITGEPADESDSMALINAIGNLPDKQYKECMAGMDPVIQMQVVYQMSKEDKKTLENFDNSAYTTMLIKLQKPDIVKSMAGLEIESLQQMIAQLPKDLFAIVATQVDVEEFAKFLISDCKDVLANLGAR